MGSERVRGHIEFLNQVYKENNYDKKEKVLDDILDKTIADFDA